MKRMFSSKVYKTLNSSPRKMKTFSLATDLQVPQGTPPPFKKDVRPSGSPPSCALGIAPYCLGVPGVGVPWSPAPLGLPGSSWPHQPTTLTSKDITQSDA